MIKHGGYTYWQWISTVKLFPCRSRWYLKEETLSVIYFWLWMGYASHTSLLACYLIGAVLPVHHLCRKNANMFIFNSLYYIFSILPKKNLTCTEGWLARICYIIGAVLSVHHLWRKNACSYLIILHIFNSTKDKPNLYRTKASLEKPEAVTYTKKKI